jgi:tetratricopeptide (TPR) repeat protein
MANLATFIQAGKMEAERMVTGWRRLTGVAIACLVLALCPIAALADDLDDCNSLDADARIRGCSAIIDSGTETAKIVAMAHNNRGAAYRSKGDPERAIEDFNRAIALNPKHAKAYNNRGFAYYDKGQIDQAIKDFDKAIALDPKFAIAYNNRGVAYHGKESPDRAIEDFDRAIEFDPKYTKAYYNRGLAYDSKGDTGLAIKDYDQAIDLDSKQADYFNSRCWVRAVAGTGLDLARADCDAALALSKDEPNVLDSRGLVGIKEGQFAKAWADYDAAHRAKPENAGFLYGRGIAALRLGRTAEGNADLAAAMKLDGTIAATYADYGVTPP